MRKNSGVIKTLIAVAASAVIIIVCLAVYLPGRHKVADPSTFPLKAYFFDVGQGDCELIQCEGVNVLIDGGEADYGRRVEAYLKRCGVETIDCYILTHPHSDHIGAAAHLIDAFDIRDLMMTEFSELNVPTTKAYEDTLEAAATSNATVSFVKGGDRYTNGALTLEILAPLEETDDYNDMSIVVRVSYKGTSLLYMGDASSNVEAQLLTGNAALSADVLKVGHHGSVMSSSPAFLKEVSPEYAVISCGADNAYGHPNSETLKSLADVGSEVFRTDSDGTVLIFGDGKKLYVRRGNDVLY